MQALITVNMNTHALTQNQVIVKHSFDTGIAATATTDSKHSQALITHWLALPQTGVIVKHFQQLEGVLVK